MAEELDEKQLAQLAAKMRAAEYKGLTDEEIKKRERQKEARRQKNIAVLEDTLQILANGGYSGSSSKVHLSLTDGQMCEAIVYLPEDINGLCRDFKTRTNEQTYKHACIFECENADSLDLAERKFKALQAQGEREPKILVLNMASATHPGGRVREGAAAQEEELCRRTSLLLSLESEGAKRYYDYNNAQKSRMGTDSVIISPHVEVIKNAAYEPISDPFCISVISASAPMVRLGLEGKSQNDYEEMLYKRICGMLLIAARENYRHLILGAFGCGVFGNDAALVSDLFSGAFRDLSECGCTFDSIDFAVLCRADNDYNFREFCRNFST